MSNDGMSSQEDLNMRMKKREREDYYEDKLLELKMQKFLDNYLLEHELSKYKSKLSDLKNEKVSLLKEKEDLRNKISERRQAKKNYEKTIKDLDSKISDAKNNKKEIESNIKIQREYLEEMTKEENLVNYIIKNYQNDFKKEIYEICSNSVHEALKNKDLESKNNIKEKNNSNKNRNKNDSKFTMVNEQRDEFISYSNNIPSQPGTIPNMQNMNMKPMMPPNAYNNQYMMYPMYFPVNPNMQGYQNPYYFFHMVNPNLQQSKENNGDNNKNK